MQSTFGDIIGNTIGSPITVNINLGDPTYEHALSYTFEDVKNMTISGYIKDKATFTLPIDYCKKVPDSATAVLTLILRTFDSNNRQVGTDIYKSVIVNVPDDLSPTFEFNSTRINNGVALGMYVERFSKVKLDISNEKAMYGASIKSFNISGAGFNSKEKTATFGPFVGNGSGETFDLSFTATVTDTRGISASKTIIINVSSYVSPTLELKVERCDRTGNADTKGTYLKITPTYSFTSFGGINYISSKIFQIVDTSYTNTSCASGSSIVLGNNDIDTSKKYEVYAKVTDALGGFAEVHGYIGTASKVVNIKANKRGICFGGYAVYDDTVHFIWDLRIENNRLILADGTILELDKINTGKDIFALKDHTHDYSASDHNHDDIYVQKAELLWENASPTSTFNPQTINLDLSNYDFVGIIFRLSTKWDGRSPMYLFKKNYQGTEFTINVVKNERVIQNISDNGVVFKDGRNIDEFPHTGQSDNTLAIPLQIYGVRGL